MLSFIEMSVAITYLHVPYNRIQNHTGVSVRVGTIKCPLQGFLQMFCLHFSISLPRGR